nr:uncharacterized protein CI109_001724 [Kwoniella shandongensis]KAA5529785.1 hypothetical protein CI109_001724 [Kwoniella shandongensis]
MSAFPTSGLQLPFDVIIVVAKHLKDDNDIPTLLSLQRSCQYGYKAATPVIYPTVRLGNDKQWSSIFAPFAAGLTSEGSADAVDGCGVGPNESQHVRSEENAAPTQEAKFDISSAIERCAWAFNFTEHVIVEALPSEQHRAISLASASRAYHIFDHSQVFQNAFRMSVAVTTFGDNADHVYDPPAHYPECFLMLHKICLPQVVCIKTRPYFEVTNTNNDHEAEVFGNLDQMVPPAPAVNIGPLPGDHEHHEHQTTPQEMQNQIISFLANNLQHFFCSIQTLVIHDSERSWLQSHIVNTAPDVRIFLRPVPSDTPVTNRSKAIAIVRAVEDVKDLIFSLSRKTSFLEGLQSESGLDINDRSTEICGIFDDPQFREHDVHREEGEEGDKDSGPDIISGITISYVIYSRMIPAGAIRKIREHLGHADDEEVKAFNALIVKEDGLDTVKELNFVPYAEAAPCDACGELPI